MRLVALALGRLFLFGALLVAPLHLHGVSDVGGSGAASVSKATTSSLIEQIELHTCGHAPFARAGEAHLPPTPPASSPRLHSKWPSQRHVDIYTLLSQYRI